MKKLSLSVEPADHGERLDRFIASRGGISRGQARRLLDGGGVWVDSRRVKIASRAVWRGQKVVVVLEEAGRTAPDADARLSPERILLEDELVIAVDKPPFVPAQGTLASDKGSLVWLVSRHVGRTVDVVHRLDRETSGVTIFGKTKAATSALAAAFREGRARKVYLAIACGELPDEGRVDLPLSPDRSRKGRFVAREGGAVPAATRFRVLSRRGGIVAVELFPETGRTHQIRAHLAALAAPIAGDSLYGGPRQLPGADGPALERFLLHARSLEVPHPAGGEIAVRAPIPDDLARALALAGADPSGL